MNQGATTTVITAPAGELEGNQTASGLAFLGIPYARPPLGPLRFRPPEPAPRWSGRRSAAAYGPSAPQDPAEPGIPYMPLHVGLTDEDCLYLNVWTPAADAQARPVLFWVHGGNFVAGSGAEPFYNGAALAAEQYVVVVTINYRLGALGGFVFLNDLDDRLAESANVGLLDIALALQWVTDNIAAFGGDPDCVTLAGQSAGGKLVASVLAMPVAQGLYHRAILQSPGSPNVFEREQGQALAAKYLRHLGSADPQRIVAATAEELWRAAVPLAAELTMGPSGPPIGPTLDGPVLTTQPLTAVADGSATGVPLLVGSTTHELELLLRGAGLDKAGEEVLAALAQMFDEPLRDKVLANYTSSALASASPPMPHPVVAVLGDRMVRLGGIRLLEAQSTAPTFGYLLEWATEVDSGATHCTEIPLLFDTADVPDARALLGSGSHVSELGRSVRDAWAEFMRTGEPNIAGSEWPPYTTGGRATVLLGRSPAVIDDPWSAQRRAWDGVETPGGPLPSFSTTSFSTAEGQQ